MGSFGVHRGGVRGTTVLAASPPLESIALVAGSEEPHLPTTPQTPGHVDTPSQFHTAQRVHLPALGPLECQPLESPVGTGAAPIGDACPLSTLWALLASPGGDTRARTTGTPAWVLSRGGSWSRAPVRS